MARYADYVRCGYCEEEMYVLMTTDVCPKCKHRGGLEWADIERQEVEVEDSEIINLDDYENVMNDTEYSVN